MSAPTIATGACWGFRNMPEPRTLLIEGVARRYVRDLAAGDRVDLEGDVIADPEGGDDHPEFAFEFEVVASVERETPDCYCVYFESGFACGFPPDHLVDVDGEQNDPAYRVDYDRLSGTAIIVRLADDLTSLRFTGTEATDLNEMTRDEVAALADDLEFS